MKSYIQNIGNLHSLTILKLNFNELPITPLTQTLAANKIPIKNFQIIFGRMDKDGAESVTQLKKLEVLEFHKCLNWSEDHLVTLAKGLPNLLELHFINGISKLKFRIIVDIQVL